MFAAAIPIASAHTPAWDIPTYAYITAAPDPVGVQQTVTLVLWLNLVPPTAAGSAGDRWIDMTVEVTKPDNTKETLGPFTSDPVGSTYALYTPDQVGTYTFALTYPGQVLNGSAGTGVPNIVNMFGMPSENLGDNYLPSTATTTITVQDAAVPNPADYPLPTEYWTRPIDGQNTAWESIASNWLGETYQGKVQPDGTAPNSAHIMWRRPLQDGGIVGVESTSTITGASFYDGTAYEGKFTTPIIINGRLYYSIPLSNNPTGGGYISVDLKTGEQIWLQNYTTSPSFGQLYTYESMNQHGVIPSYLWSASGGFNSFGPALPETWTAYDGATGNWLFTLNDVPSGTTVYGPNGEILRYVLDTSGNQLKLWNNTAFQALTGATTPDDITSTSFYQWRPVGKVVNANNTFSWNVSIPALPMGSSINKVIPDDMIIGGVGFGGLLTASTDPYTVWAISLKPESRGQLLWMKNYSAPAGNLTRSFDAVDPVNRVFIVHDMETMQWTGYSIDDGSYLWGPTESEDAWNFYTWASTIVDSKLITNGYGAVYCYDTLTGDLLWEFKAPGGMDIPYTNYPLAVTAIADGKVYLGMIEHSRNAPYWKGAKVYCVDIESGEEIWSIASASPSVAGGMGQVTNGFAVADGYAVYLDLYSMQVTCIGKGPSATTVTAPNIGVTLGNSVLLQGTVTDIAAGTKQNEQEARFPNGVPAVSDESQSAWMEYVYMQKPKPTDVTGVSVHLTAIDPNGNFQDIGTVSSSADGTYAVTWTPPVSGLYHVTATFEGSNSYYSSSEATYFTVSEAPSASPTTTPPPQQTETPTQTAAPTSVQSASPLPSEAPQPSTSEASSTTTYIVIVAAVIVIAVVAAAVLLRRRK
jgi:outer membrane protein assembly factor BamB